ncbi:hypothetical protein D3C86_1003290 [compost metagenome]
MVFFGLVLVNRASRKTNAASAIAFCSAASSPFIGIAMPTASRSYAIKFVQASLYFLALSEVAANLLQKSEMSKGYFLAMGMTVATPFVY